MVSLAFCRLLPLISLEAYCQECKCDFLHFGAASGERKRTPKGTMEFISRRKLVLSPQPSDSILLP
jgi:hypothetical protein